MIQFSPKGVKIEKVRGKGSEVRGKKPVLPKSHLCAGEFTSDLEPLTFLRCRDHLTRLALIRAEAQQCGDVAGPVQIFVVFQRE